MADLHTLTIAVVAYSNALPSALHGLGEMFQMAEHFRAQAPESHRPRLVLEYRACGVDGVAAGIAARAIAPDSDGKEKEADVVIIPPCRAGGRPEYDRTLLHRWLHRHHRQGALLASACAGAFILGESGLLQGRRITTHWLLAEEFRQRFPETRLDEAQLVVDEGDLLTAGGVTAWIDLSVQILQRFYGPTLVMQLSKYFLIDCGERQQRYYRSFVPRFDHGDEPIVRVQHWLQRRFAEPCTLAQMAGLACLSERTLQRRFVRATGFSPSAYLQQLRLQRARELLETSHLPIEQIVWSVGYEDRGTFRKLFKTEVGLSPSEYRQRFQQGMGALEPLRGKPASSR